MKIRTVLADDEPLARERLRRLLRNDRDIEIVAEGTDGPSALEAVREHGPDLLLLDVQMPGMNGFEVLRALDPKRLPAVIFVTGFDQYAVEAFEARALDYLLKPTNRSRLEEALARARERLTAKSSGGVPQGLLDLLSEREAASNCIKRFSVRNGERVTFVPAGDVDWIEAAGNYALLHVGRTTHILRETMTALESQLPREAFLRVSRSAILNLSRVKELQNVSATEQVAILEDGQAVPMTRSIREVEERLRFV